MASSGKTVSTGTDMSFLSTLLHPLLPPRNDLHQQAGHIGGGGFAMGIFRCGKFRTSNVCEISCSILRLLCEIHSCRNLATLARHHPALVWLGFPFLWCLLQRGI